jgi:Fic family protein
MPVISLPIYTESYRPSSNWVKTLLEKQQQFNLQPLSTEIQTKIKEILLTRQIEENLLLSDIKAQNTNISELIQKKETQEKDLVIRNFINTLNYVENLIESSTDKTKLLVTSEFLRQLHALMMAGLDEQAGFYRKTPGKSISSGHSPADPEVLSILIENALDWFSAESFAELHPLEQAWLVHLRIMDLQPFSSGNGRIARLVASFYAQKANLCPIIIRASQRELYNHAVNNSLMMITQPGVELLANSVIQTYDEILDLVKASNS